MTYQELVATRKQLDTDRAAHIKKADGLLAKEDFGEDDQAEVDRLKGQIGRIKARMELLDIQIAEALNAPVSRDLSRPVAGDEGDGDEGDDDGDEGPSTASRRSPITTRPAHGKRGIYGSLAEQAMDVYRHQALGDGASRERLVNNAVHILKEAGLQAASGQSIAVDSEGGHLVQTDFSTDIWQRMTQGNQILGLIPPPLPLNPGANSIELPGVDETSRANGSRWGGIRGYRVEEGAAITSSKQTYYRVALKLKKYAALTYATDEMLSHVAVMERMLGEGMADELRFLAEDDVFEGSGAAGCHGVTEAAAVISVSKETGQVAATILHDNLKKMWARRHPGFGSNYVWLINQDCEPTLDDLAKVIGTSGVEPNYVSYGPDGVLRIKGRPVITVEYASTLGTIDDIVLVDFNQYVSIMEGIKNAASIHFKFDTDETSFRSTLRMDGALRWKSALTPFKGTNTQSPVITLATRA